MTHARDLCRKISLILDVDGWHNGYPTMYRQARLAQLLQFMWIVGEKTQRTYTQILQNCHGTPVGPLIGLMTKQEVRVNGIIALILKIVCLQLLL